jgi:hypothetical protein
LRDRLDLHIGLETMRIHRLDARREDDQIVKSAQQGEIALQIARISAEIFVLSELRRIDEDRDGDVVVLSRGAPYQRQMSFM